MDEPKQSCCLQINNNRNTNLGAVDIGTTGHFLLIKTKCNNIQPTTTPLKVQMPNGESILSTHTADLPIPALPSAATKAHLFPHLAANALLSIGVLCDNGCEALFTATTVTITLQGKVVMVGHRQSPGLWYVDLENPTANKQTTQQTTTTDTANVIIDAKTQAELMEYLHATAFSPVESTFIQAIEKGHFTTWPGLTAEAVRKHLPKSMATAKGHLDQQRKNIQSTKHKKPNQKQTTPTIVDEGLNPTPAITDGLRTHYVFAATIELYLDDPGTGKLFSDLTGRFPTTSSRGNKYVLVVYDYDSNAVIGEPMKTAATRKHYEHTRSSSNYSLVVDYDHSSNDWTMRHPRNSSNTYKTKLV
jgi:hypothetical protein